MTYRTSAQRAYLAEDALEKIEREIEALRYDLNNAISIHEQEEITLALRKKQAEYRMVSNSIGL